MTNTPVQLRGLTWGHTRGYAPMAVTAQIFADHNPHIEIVWDRRSLWAFGEQSLDEVVASYDLLVVDHPLVGSAAESGLLALDRHVPMPAMGAVGASQESYRYGGHYYAVAIDAACQVAATRPDLLDQHGMPAPKRWHNVIDLARSTGAVALPLTPIDLYSSFLTLCAQLGKPAYPADSRQFVDADIAAEALGLLRELAVVTEPNAAAGNPIQILERMATDDDIVYCPLIFGYTNYSRDGYVRQPVTFHDLPCVFGDGPHGSCLGGAGLAISAASPNLDAALAYAQWVADPETQRTEYLRAGGQPAARAAWDDPAADILTRGFFTSTRATIDAARPRPTYPGFPQFQTRAAALIQDAILSNGHSGRLLDTLETDYQRSRQDVGTATQRAQP